MQAGSRRSPRASHAPDGAPPRSYSCHTRGRPVRGRTRGQPHVALRLAARPDQNQPDPGTPAPSRTPPSPTAHHPYRPTPGTAHPAPARTAPPPAADPYGAPAEPVRRPGAGTPASRRPANPYGGHRGRLRKPTFGFGGYAGWFTRVGAYVIDYIAGALAAAPALDRLRASCCPTRPPPPTPTGTTTSHLHRQRRRPLILILIGVVTSLAFFIWNVCIRQGRTGATIGKSVLAIRLVNADMQPIGGGLGVPALAPAHRRRAPLLPRLPLADLGRPEADLRRQDHEHLRDQGDDARSRAALGGRCRVDRRSAAEPSDARSSRLSRMPSVRAGHADAAA